MEEQDLMEMGITAAQRLRALLEDRNFIFADTADPPRERKPGPMAPPPAQLPKPLPPEPKQLPLKPERKAVA